MDEIKWSWRWMRLEQIDRPIDRSIVILLFRIGNNGVEEAVMDEVD